MRAAAAVFIFVSMPGEPETEPLILELLAEGRTVYVPRCRPGRRMECVAISGMGDLAEGPMGIREPRAGLPDAGPDAADFCVVPALACGLDGSRLGQGGGYYDSFLARFKGRHAAVCFDAFVADTLPTEPHDRPVGRIVTQTRCIEVRGGHET